MSLTKTVETTEKPIAHKIIDTGCLNLEQSERIKCKLAGLLDKLYIEQCTEGNSCEGERECLGMLDHILIQDHKVGLNLSVIESTLDELVNLFE